MILRILGIEIGNKNRSKYHPKSMLTCEGILAPIFHRFLSISVAKLDLSWHQKSNKNGHEKPRKNEAPKKPSWGSKKRFLGGQEAPKTSQNGAKTGQVGVKMGQVGAKTARDGAKTFQDDPTTGQVCVKILNVVIRSRNSSSSL